MTKTISFPIMIGILVLILFSACEEELDYIDCKWVRVNDGPLNSLPLYSVYCVSDCPDGTWDIQLECDWIHLYKDKERLEYKNHNGINSRDIDGESYTYN